MAYQLFSLLKKLTNTSIVTSAAATGLLVYALLRKKYHHPAALLQLKKAAKHDKHLITHAFAKAKNHEHHQS